MDQLSYIVETLLSYWLFVEYGSKLMQNPDNLKTTFQQLELFRNVISNGIDCSLGTNGWKFPKWIEICHLLLEILIYGPPRTHDTNFSEKHLKI